MPDWKKLVPKPSGALPANLMNRVVAILAVVLVVVIVAASLGGAGSEEEEGEGAAAEIAPPDPEMADRLGSAVEAKTQQAAFERVEAELDAEREAVRERNLRLAEEQAPTGQRILERLMESRSPPEDDTDAWDPEVFSPQEAELRLRLHLEAIERRQRSLLAAPVAHTVRDPDALVQATPEAPEPSSQNHLAEFYKTLGDAALQQQSTAGITPTSAASPPGGTLDVPLPDSNNPPSYERPGRVVAPDDPAGFHRIHEGSFVEAVLVTQLSGDFPSPVAAVVAVPFYSGDRQTVLIPRGSRFIGTAQAVRDQNQSRLAVGFHRLVFPDGRWAELRFQGLNQVGEGALKDQVDRHYLSTFLAAGGVGLLSGLATAGANSYDESLAASAQVGSARSFSQTGIQIMDRFLNRLPTVTIRAGHRLRVWFTADLLIPPTQSTTHPQQ